MTKEQNIQHRSGWFRYFIGAMVLMLTAAPLSINPAHAFTCTTSCCVPCSAISQEHGKTRSKIIAEALMTRNHITAEFRDERNWWNDHVLPTIEEAMQDMADTVTAAALMQAHALGAVMDAEQQLETQLLLQERMAEAHRDYSPGENVCAFGSNSGSLPWASEQVEDKRKMLSRWSLRRELGHAQVLGAEGTFSDTLGRVDQMKKAFCNPADMHMGFDQICNPTVTISFTSGTTPFSVGDEVGKSVFQAAKQTLNATGAGDIDASFGLASSFAGNLSGEILDNADIDVSSLFRVSNLKLWPNPDPSCITEEQLETERAPWLTQINLLSSPDLVMRIPQPLLVRNITTQYDYMDFRALTAQRNVAAASLHALYAMKSPSTRVPPGGAACDPLDEGPSYDEIMETATKKFILDAGFFVELMDKPTEILRQDVTIQAYDLMQTYDLLESKLRTEMMLSQLLELELEKEQARLTNEMGL